MAALAAAKEQDRGKFNASLQGVLTTMNLINCVMGSMWTRSLSEDYLQFRTFIMGTKNQPMFPNGVIYEGVSEEPRFYRGESGANDSIIPSMDNLLELTGEMPSNPLTKILKDFRTYRPGNHNEYVSFVETEARAVGVRSFSQKDAKSAALYLALLDQIRDFRARHWNFTKEYIIKHTNHPVATGGSPIVTWLPNQLSTVMEQMLVFGRGLELPKPDPEIDEMLGKASTQLKVLQQEVRHLSKLFKQ